MGIGVGDRVFMLGNAIYSVISPEGCAAILWKDRAYAPDAAKALLLTAKDLLELGVINGIIPEPLGGAHRDYGKAAQDVKRAVKNALDELKHVSIEKVVEKRYEKYRKIGEFIEGGGKI